MSPSLLTAFFHCGSTCLHDSVASLGSEASLKELFPCRMASLRNSLLMGHWASGDQEMWKCSSLSLPFPLWGLGLTQAMRRSQSLPAQRSGRGSILSAAAAKTESHSPVMKELSPRGRGIQVTKCSVNKEAADIPS